MQRGACSHRSAINMRAYSFAAIYLSFYLSAILDDKRRARTAPARASHNPSAFLSKVQMSLEKEEEEEEGAGVGENLIAVTRG